MTKKEAKRRSPLQAKFIKGGEESAEIAKILRRTPKKEMAWKDSKSEEISAVAMED